MGGKGSGRPKLTDQQKAERKQARDEARAAAIASGQEAPKRKGTGGWQKRELPTCGLTEEQRYERAQTLKVLASSKSPRAQAKYQEMKAKLKSEIVQGVIDHGSKYGASLSTGMSYATILLWESEDPVFAQAIVDANGQLLSKYEHIVDERISQGVKDPSSAVLTMFRMKRLDPQYRDNAQPVINVNTLQTMTDEQLLAQVQRAQMLAGTKPPTIDIQAEETTEAAAQGSTS